MVNLDIDIVGLAELRGLLDRLEDVVNRMRTPTEESLNLLKQRMQAYPAPPAGSKYVRTNNLKNSWQENVIMDGRTFGRLESRISYGPYVQDADNQAGIHQGRWQTVQSVEEDERDNILGLYERELDRLISK